MLILLALYAVLLAAATFIESRYGSSAARAVVYNNVLFYLLQLLFNHKFCRDFIESTFMEASEIWGYYISLGFCCRVSRSVDHPHLGI